MDILNKFLELASKEIGVAEYTNGKSNPRIVYYDSFTTLKATNDETPWCSAFVCAIVEMAGLKSTKSAAARSWLEWGQEINDPLPGSIVVMKRGINPNQGHVGFLKEISPTFVTILGGNQGHKVCEASFFKTSILSYRIPNNDR